MFCLVFLQEPGIATGWEWKGALLSAKSFWLAQKATPVQVFEAHGKIAKIFLVALVKDIPAQVIEAHERIAASCGSHCGGTKSNAAAYD